MTSNKNGLVPQEHWDSLYQNSNLVQIYDNDPVSLWLHQFVPPGQGKSCFEIGCYPGRILSFFGKKGYTLSGVDLTPNVEQLPGWFQSLGYDIGKFQRSDFFALDTKEQYDIVGSFGFIEHFNDWHEVILKQASLVKENGLVVIEVPNFAGAIQRLLHLFLDYKNYMGHTTSAMYPIVWSEILSLIGFEIIYCGYFGKFGFWVQEPSASTTKLVLTYNILRSMEKLKKADTPDHMMAPYCGVIARKTTNQSISDILCNSQIKMLIDQKVAKIKHQDLQEDQTIRSIVNFFEILT